jgi:hypothetical protein
LPAVVAGDNWVPKKRTGDYANGATRRMMEDWYEDVLELTNQAKEREYSNEPDWDLQELKDYCNDPSNECTPGGGFAFMPSTATPAQQLVWIAEQRELGVLVSSPAPRDGSGLDLWIDCFREKKHLLFYPYVTDECTVIESCAVMCFDALTLAATCIDAEVCEP